MYSRTKVIWVKYTLIDPEILGGWITSHLGYGWRCKAPIGYSDKTPGDKTNNINFGNNLFTLILHRNYIPTQFLGSEISLWRISGLSSISDRLIVFPDRGAKVPRGGVVASPASNKMFMNKYLNSFP